ncbi:hypothetical protein BDA99DRAFT_227158 [Phascolomyces articulosus]|uniref:Uncharacterized protein n=1 Tax=Phascolomyces articulosus TaxID=60185 RepID=A0AAD5K048_9FUNG|nr:hypothetical protein BDA99DRAFT_227158 [Phascolomyces articulosus]
MMKTLFLENPPQPISSLAIPMCVLSKGFLHNLHTCMHYIKASCYSSHKFTQKELQVVANVVNYFLRPHAPISTTAMGNDTKTYSMFELAPLAHTRQKVLSAIGLAKQVWKNTLNSTRSVALSVSEVFLYEILANTYTIFGNTNDPITSHDEASDERKAFLSSFFNYNKVTQLLHKQNLKFEDSVIYVDR